MHAKVSRNLFLGEVIDCLAVGCMLFRSPMQFDDNAVVMG